jgi:MFS transporter, putative metabolite:H+ symporter
MTKWGVICVSNASIAVMLNGLPLTSRHKVAAFVIGFALFFEFFDVNLSGVLGTVLQNNFM